MALVSIILPTFNRESHLAEAFRAICAQSFEDWELIVIDDGSTDNSRERVVEFAAQVEHPVKHCFQTNQGAYAARNRGLDEATGEFIAFYDSDDTWLPHHLERCVAALQLHPDVDWVFAAYRQMNSRTEEVLQDSSFYYKESAPRPFLSLHKRVQGRLNVIDDPRLTQYMLMGDVPAALQVSVIREGVFEHRRFRSDLRNCEDRFFRIRLASEGGRFAYFDDVHLIYKVHSENSSAVAENATPDRLRQVFEAFVKGLEDLRSELPLKPIEKRVLNHQLSALYFWSLGYDVFWQTGRTKEAFHCFRKGIRLCPWQLWYWKTYLLSCLKRVCGLSR